jgi:hypothetical protein
MEDPMEKKSVRSAMILRKPGLIAVLLLTALSLSACVVSPARDHHRGWRHHHQWNNDGDWNGRHHGPGWGNSGWQGGGGSWKRQH